LVQGGVGGPLEAPGATAPALGPDFGLLLYRIRPHDEVFAVPRPEVAHLPNLLKSHTAGLLPAPILPVSTAGYGAAVLLLGAMGHEVEPCCPLGRIATDILGRANNRSEDVEIDHRVLSDKSAVTRPLPHAGHDVTFNEPTRRRGLRSPLAVRCQRRHSEGCANLLAPYPVRPPLSSAERVCIAYGLLRVGLGRKIFQNRCDHLARPDSPMGWCRVHDLCGMGSRVESRDRGNRGWPRHTGIGAGKLSLIAVDHFPTA